MTSLATIRRRAAALAYHAVGAAALAVLWGAHRLGRRIPPRRRPAGRVRVAMVAFVGVRSDNRIQRAARVLADAGYAVTLLTPRDVDAGWDPAGAAWARGIEFARAGKSVSFVLFPRLFDVAVYRRLVALDADVVHCHDLPVALLGLFAARRTGAKLFVDFHEWGSESGKLDADGTRFVGHRGPSRWLLRAAEGAVCSDADAVSTVTASLTEEIPKSHGLARRLVLLRNTPSIEQDPAPHDSIRAALDVAPDLALFVFQGLLGPMRNIERAIEALKFAPRAALAIRGIWHDVYGPGYLAAAAAAGVARRVFVVPAVPSSRVVAALNGADVAVVTVKPFSKSVWFGLGNKVLEALAAGKPMILNDSPENRRLVEDYGVGALFDPDDPASIAAAMNRLADDPEFRARCAANAARAWIDLDLAREWDKLPRAYSALWEGSP